MRRCRQAAPTAPPLVDGHTKTALTAPRRGSESTTEDNHARNSCAPRIKSHLPLVRRRFREKHDRDPVTLPENHPDAQAVRAEFVTEYGQRAALDRADGGRPLTIMATVPANGVICAFYGLDLAARARDGLVDILCPYEFGMLDAGPEPLNLDDHCAAVRGTAVKLLPFLNTWRDGDPVKVLEKALAMTWWPIAGFSMWDGILRSAGFDKALSALHSAEGIRDLIVALRAEKPVHHDLVMLDGVHSDKYSFGWNF